MLKSCCEKFIRAYSTILWRHLATTFKPNRHTYGVPWLWIACSDVVHWGVNERRPVCCFWHIIVGTCDHKNLQLPFIEDSHSRHNAHVLCRQSWATAFTALNQTTSGLQQSHYFHAQWEYRWFTNHMTIMWANLNLAVYTFLLCTTGGEILVLPVRIQWRITDWQKGAKLSPSSLLSSPWPRYHSLSRLQRLKSILPT